MSKILKNCIFLIICASSLILNSQGETQSFPTTPGLSPESMPLSSAIPAIPNPDLKIVINIPEMKLRLYEKGALVSEHTVAVGMPQYQTPIGSYSIERIEWNPWWLPPDSDWAKDAEKTPPGPGNPLGPVKMVMDDALRIHGTNKPGSVGRAASHACIRMHNEEAKELAWYIQSRSSLKNDEKLLEKYSKNRKSTFYVALDHSTPVEFIYEPVSVTQESIEVLPDVYGKMKKLKDVIIEKVQLLNIDANVLDPEKLSKLKKPYKDKLVVQLSDLVFNPLNTESASTK